MNSPSSATRPQKSATSELLTVERAAIRIGDAVFSLPRPNRHHNIIWWLSALGIPSTQLHDQGFVLSDGCYVDRVSAAHFADIAGQVQRLIAPPNLYSEDLWDGGNDLPLPEDIRAMAAPAIPDTPHVDEVADAILASATRVGSGLNNTDGERHG